MKKSENWQFALKWPFPYSRMLWANLLKTNKATFEIRRFLSQFTLQGQNIFRIQLCVLQIRQKYDKIEIFLLHLLLEILRVLEDLDASHQVV